MNPTEELAYLKRVCEAAELCAACKHFELKNSETVEGYCEICNIGIYGYDTEPECGSMWERRPEPWESETCGTCLHFAKFAQKTVLWNNCWIKSIDPNNSEKIVLSKEQKACKDWRPEA